MPRLSGVPAFIPLSLLEALRNLDTPLDDGLEELVNEVVTKRLGLSSTVAAQIERYQDDVEDGQPVPRDEAVGVFRLVGRRPDGALAFADAGRRAARHAAAGSGAGARTIMRVVPDGMSRKVGFRTASKVAGREFGADLRQAGKAIEARIDDPLSIAAMPDGEACGFYGAMLAELVRVLAGMEGTMTHERCRGTGDAACTWRWADAEGYK